jgi:hypothetical protein
VNIGTNSFEKIETNPKQNSHHTLTQLSNIKMPSSPNVIQTIRRTFTVQDRSLKAMEAMGVPSHLWNEIRNLPTFGKKTIVVERPKTPTPPSSPPPTETKESDDTLSKSISNPVYDEQFLRNMRENYLNYFDWLESCPSYWQDEIEKQEFRRSYYHRKKAWSATDEKTINKIDKRLAYCQMRLEKLLTSKMNEVEYEDEDDDTSTVTSEIHLEDDKDAFLVESI